MENLSEDYIRKNCPHCHPSDDDIVNLLKETDNFRIICDPHPIMEGHILIIPKEHISCLAEFPINIFEEFLSLYDEMSKFIKETYGKLSTFEHGKIGQTVFHSHVHLLPYNGQTENIVPEGISELTMINKLEDLKTIFKSDGQYLIFSIEENMWVVNTALGAPRFFRDRFANAIGKPERGNWKDMHIDPNIMREALKENTNCKQRWLRYN